MGCNFILAPLVLVAYYGLTVPGPDGGSYSRSKISVSFYLTNLLAAFWRNLDCGAGDGYLLADWVSGGVFSVRDDI